MNSLSTTATLICLSFFSLSLPAQEIGYIDLTDNIFRESSRQVRVGGGGCGGTSDPTHNSQSEVTVTLVSLDKLHYQLGEEAIFEIKVLNSGKEKIVIPWTPHLGDLEPTDTNASYKYRVGVIVLLLRDPEGMDLDISDSLYGSGKVPGSFRELFPGQWFTVKGKKKIELHGQNWGNKEFNDVGFVDTKVSAFFRQDRGAYSPRNGGTVNQQCIPLRYREANQLNITVEQTSR